MSWLNNSLNTIKGQLTNLAQEVLADTAGPGDDDYRGNEMNTKTALELLSETQQQKEQLDKVCEDKDREIAALRKQIQTLKIQKISKGAGDGDSTTDKSLQPGDDQNVDDSWCWEPASSVDTAAGTEPTETGVMVDIALGATDVTRLNAEIANLEQQNGELRNSLDELDAQHDQAMQDVLGHKMNLQVQLQELKQIQADRLVEHELAMARLQAQLGDEQKRAQTASTAHEELQQRVELLEKELMRSALELGEMQQLLEKRGADNVELIDRVRQADAERDKLQGQLDELAKLAKEKKTSESSNSSSTGKHSEDEFIVVRNTDTTGSSSEPDPDADATTPPSKEKLRDKLVALEARIAELTANNLKLQDSELERQLAGSVLTEQMSELETRLRISESEKEQLQLELQRKLQQLMLQNQELKLNAEADQETHANDLEEQLGSLRAENRQLRQELDSSIAQAKFRQAIAEEKQEITDLDMEPEESDPHNLRSLLEALMAENTEQALDRTQRLLNERWQRSDNNEQRLIELQDQQLISEHEKKTLEADISQYILQCDELMKNNELLLNELDKFKRNKLETIEEHHEETIAQLEAQLEEAQSQLQRQAQQLQMSQQPTESVQAEEHLIRQLDGLKAQLQQYKDTHPEQQQQQQQELELLRQQLKELEAVKEHQDQELQKKTDHVVKLEDLHNEQKCMLSALHDQVVKRQIDCQSTAEQYQLLITDLEELIVQMGGHGQRTHYTQIDQFLQQIQTREDQLEQIQRQAARSEQMLIQMELQQLHLLESNERNDELTRELEQQRNELRETNTTMNSQLMQLTEQLQISEEQLAAARLQLDESQREIELKLGSGLATEQRQQLTQQLQAKEEQCIELEKKLQQAEEERHAQMAESGKVNELLKLELRQLKEASGASDGKQLDELAEQLLSKVAELEQLREQLELSAQVQQSLDTLNAEKLELIKALQQKHAENTQYYAEIQRLQPLEQQLGELIKEREKQMDQITFLKEKSDILTTNLLTEQSNHRLLQQQQHDALEQQSTVQRDLERLRAHLLETEELHTQETVELQRELDEARAKQASLQQEVSKSSTAYTSASIRANQQAETLQAQHSLLLQQRDELLAKLGQCEDRELKQQAAITNLQCALEQFQNDKNHDIEMATQRIRRELCVQMEKQSELQSETAALQQQLIDANEGLRAAARLSDQLEAGQQAIAVLRDEVETYKSANLKLEQNLSCSESSQTDKIDKSLIKSLLIGYVVSGHAGDKQQVLRMISSVLDFNAQESDKVGLNKPQSSWLGNILGSGASNSGPGNDNLIQAFVQFLEQESQPQPQSQTRPTLLSMSTQEGIAAPNTAPISTNTAATAAPTDTSTAATAAASAASKTVSNSSSTNEHTSMPAMQSLLMSNNEFAPTRNSSSILKDILSDS